MHANNPNPTQTYGVLATMGTSSKVPDDVVYAWHWFAVPALLLLGLIVLLQRRRRVAGRHRLSAGRAAA
jgi:hypothetical protein